jgi:type II secretory pathway pseudopilin PulG
MLSKKQKQKKFLFKKKSWGKSGFTLVELLVVSAIVILMAGALISVVANRNKPATEVESAAEQLVSKLKNLQNNAVNGDMGNSGATVYCNFDFAVGFPNARSYTFTKVPCTGSVGAPVVETGFLTDRGQAGSVTATGNGAAFSVPLGAVSGSTLITLTAGTELYFVCIAVGGSVSGLDGPGQANIYASKTGCP